MYFVIGTGCVLTYSFKFARPNTSLYVIKLWSLILLLAVIDPKFSSREQNAAVPAGSLRIAQERGLLPLRHVSHPHQTRRSSSQLPEWPYTVRPALLVAVGDPTSSSMQPDAWPKVGSEERDLLLEDLLKYILH